MCVVWIIILIKSMRMSNFGNGFNSARFLNSRYLLLVKFFYIKLKVFDNFAFLFFVSYRLSPLVHISSLFSLFYFFPFRVFPGRFIFHTKQPPFSFSVLLRDLFHIFSAFFLFFNSNYTIARLFIIDTLWRRIYRNSTRK